MRDDSGSASQPVSAVDIKPAFETYQLFVGRQAVQKPFHPHISKGRPDGRNIAGSVLGILHDPIGLKGHVV